MLVSNPVVFEGLLDRSSNLSCCLPSESSFRDELCLIVFLENLSAIFFTCVKSNEVILGFLLPRSEA